jgi:hypothetical protein
MIEDYQFGSIKIDGKGYSQDVKIIDGEVVPNWWRDRGHELKPSDIDDILAARPDILVVGTGNTGNMRVDQSVRSAASEYGIELVEQNTGRAVETFNDLHSQGKRVAGAFHLTC